MIVILKGVLITENEGNETEAEGGYSKHQEHRERKRSESENCDTKSCLHHLNSPESPSTPEPLSPCSSPSIAFASRDHISAGSSPCVSTAEPYLVSFPLVDVVSIALDPHFDTIININAFDSVVMSSKLPCVTA